MIKIAESAEVLVYWALRWKQYFCLMKRNVAETGCEGSRIDTISHSILAKQKNVTFFVTITNRNLDKKNSRLMLTTK